MNLKETIGTHGRWRHWILVNGASRIMKKYATYVMWLMDVEQHATHHETPVLQSSNNSAEQQHVCTLATAATQ